MADERFAQLGTTSCQDLPPSAEYCNCTGYLLVENDAQPTFICNDQVTSCNYITMHIPIKHKNIVPKEATIYNKAWLLTQNASISGLLKLGIVW